MELKQYLAKHRIHIKDFAKQIGITPGHLYNVLRGQFPFGKKLRRKIEEHTERGVDRRDMRPGAALFYKLKRAKILKNLARNKKLAAKAERKRLESLRTDTIQ